MRHIRLAILASFLVVGLLGAVPARAAVTLAQPNILLIISDDQRLDQLRVMNNTKALFQDQGVTFANAYDSTPLCCPSRATIFSGRYAHNHGVQGNQIPDVNHLDLRYTLQRALHNAGYQTGIAGKFFNGWDITRNPPDFDRWAIMQGGYKTKFNVNGVVQQVDQYSTDFVSNQAKLMLDQFQSHPLKPWFLVVAPFAPHFPYQPAAVDVNANVGNMPANPAQTEADKSDKPPWIANYPSVNLGRTMNQVWQDQARSLRQVDRAIARVFANQKNTNNTLAFFLSDNGYMLGEHGVTEDKRVPYPEATHVPMLMRWVARLGAQPTVDTRYAMNVDIAPTIVAATGIGTKDLPHMDGRNLLGPYRRSDVLLEGYASKENPYDPGMPAWASILNDNYQYNEWYGPGGNIAFRELYNRKTDPNQMTNLFWLAPNAAPGVAAPLAQRLAKLRYCGGWTGDSPCP